MSDLNKKKAGLADHFGKAAEFHAKKADHHEGVADDHEAMMEAHKAAADAFSDHAKESEDAGVKGMGKTMAAFHKAAAAFHKAKAAKHDKMAKAHDAHADHLKKMVEQFSTDVSGSEHAGEKAVATEEVKAPEATAQKTQEPEAAKAAVAAAPATTEATPATPATPAEPAKPAEEVKPSQVDIAKTVTEAFQALDITKLVQEAVAKAVSETKQPIKEGLSMVPRTGSGDLTKGATATAGTTTDGDFSTGL